MNTTLSLAPIQSLVANNYSQERRDHILKACPRVAVDALDVYVAGVSAFGSLSQTVRGLANVSTGVAAAGHGISGLAHLAASATDDRMVSLRYRAMGIGEFVTALGFVGMTAGMGPWALPLIGIGMATTNYAQFS